MQRLPHFLVVSSLAICACHVDDDSVVPLPDASMSGPSTGTGGNSSTGSSGTGGTYAQGSSTSSSGGAGSGNAGTSGGAGGAAGSGDNTTSSAGGAAGSAGSGAGGQGGAIVDGGPPYVHFCDLPGSVRYTSAGLVTIAGGVGASTVSFLRIPTGFCAHWFGNVGNARQLRFAPNGDLFVASPTKGTTSGGQNGKNAIVIFTDDDKDGAADGPPLNFLTSIVATQGILFANDGYFYYQDDYRILRLPYHSGDRMPSAAGQQVADLHSNGATGYYTSPLHWTKSMDQADDGTIYVANGSDQDEGCDVARPFRGGIVKLDGTIAGKPVSKGYRNPTAVRCFKGHNLCMAAELSKDYSAAIGGREKLMPIRDGDDWGFPCCATKNLAYSDIPQHPDCSTIVPDDVSFFIGDTPFGFDFERGRWAAPYSGAVFVALHGAAGSWAGERIVVVATDPATGLPKPGSNIPGMTMGAMADFATGWEDGSRAHGRPTSIEFASDGRMFVGNDTNGDIFWIAPLDLVR